MWTFIALVVAVIALVMAKRAREEVRKLRAAFEAREAARFSELRPAAAPAPSVAQQPIPPTGPAPIVPAALDVAVAREEPLSKPAASPQPPTISQPAPEPSPYVPPPAQAAPPPPPRPEPPPFVPRPPATPPPPPFWKTIDWENLIGVKLFSWIGGVAFVVAAIYFLKYSVDHGWVSPPIRAAIGLIVGSALLVICELRVSRGYAVTANAMHGAGIATLYATLFAVHALWHLLPSGAVFAGMLVVTAVAVALSIRRDSLFIALLGMMGGFATPALLSTGENRPIGLFSYLLLLNVGLAWVAYRKRWPALTIGSIVFSVVYQWAWIAKFLDASQLPLAALIFVLFGVVAGTALWMSRREDKQQVLFERAGQFGVALPLIFALFSAAVPAYGARYNILFTFLLLIAAGLGVIAVLRKQDWLHALGAVATILTFAIWLTVSYTSDAWPALLGWVSAFVVLNLLIGMRRPSRIVLVAAALLFVFPALIQLEPRTASPILLFGVLLILLALLSTYALRFERGPVYFAAAFFAILTETLWSARYLTDELLYEGLAIYGVFGLMFLAVPALARRFNRRLAPQSGVALTSIASVTMLLFLTGDGVAPAALWGLAILLAVLLAGAIGQASASARPWLGAVTVLLSWIVLASWWEAAPLERALIPALFVIALFGVLVVLLTAWVRFERQTHLALTGHAFLIFVAGSQALAFPPWPFLAVLAVLDLAIGVAAVYLRRGSLLVGGAVMSQLVLLTWASVAETAPWPDVALAATLAVAAYAFAFALLVSRRSVSDDSAGPKRFTDASLNAAAGAILLGHLVAIAAGLDAAPPLLATLLATHALLVAAILLLAFLSEAHVLAVLSVPFAAAAAVIADPVTPGQTLTFASLLYALYLSYPLLLGARAKRSLQPSLAAVLASVPFFFIARGAITDAGYGSLIGLLPVTQAVLLLLLLARQLRVESQGERLLSRLALVAASALAFITAAVPLQLEKQWVTIAWALEGAALVWLYRRIAHRGLLVWAAGLLIAAFVRLTLNPDVLSYHPGSGRPIFNWYLYTYLVAAAAFFAAAYFAPRVYPRAIASCRAAGTLLLFCLLNIEIADFFSTGPALTFNFLSSSLAQDLTYTIGWAFFAIAMLVTGIVLQTRAARVAAIGLLSVTVFKCFLHDLARLGGLYRIASFLGLALALVMVSVLLQKFVLSRRAEVAS